MSLEIVGARVLAPVFGTSVFVWGSIITVFLASLAVGAALGGRLADFRPQPAVLANLLVVSGVLTWIVFLAPAPVMRFFADASVPDRFRSLLAAIALFASPCTLMGMITTFAVRLAAREIATIGAAAGRLSAISTAGSIAGSFATTFFLIPAISTPPILFGIGLLLLASAWIAPAPFSAWRLGRDGRLREGDRLPPYPRRRPGPPARDVPQQPDAGLRPDPARDPAPRELYGRRELERQVSGADVIFVDAYFADSVRAVASRLDRPAIATWGADLYDGEMWTADVPILTDDYSPTDALQHFRR